MIVNTLVVVKDGDAYEKTLIYDDTQPHQLEDEVDDYLNSTYKKLIGNN